jgi:hypothetical protein
VSPIGFLLIAVVVAVAGSLFVVLRNRQVQSPNTAMADFKREMRALAPQDESLIDQSRTSLFPHRPDDRDE